MCVICCPEPHLFGIVRVCVCVCVCACMHICLYVCDLAKDVYKNGYLIYIDLCVMKGGGRYFLFLHLSFSRGTLSTEKAISQSMFYFVCSQQGDVRKKNPSCISKIY